MIGKSTHYRRGILFYLNMVFVVVFNACNVNKYKLQCINQNKDEIIFDYYQRHRRPFIF